MVHEKFSIPKHFNVLQALQLLYSIVSNQYTNIYEQLKSISKPYETKTLEKIFKRLETELKYLNAGLWNIEKKFDMKDGWSKWMEQNEEYRIIFEEIQFLGNDIRTLRRNTVTILNKCIEQNQSKSNKFSLWNSKSKIKIRDVDEKEDEIIRKRVEHIKEIRRMESERRSDEEEKLRKQKELERMKMESRKERQLELRIKKQITSQMSKTLEKENEKRKQIELANEKKLNDLKNELIKSKQKQNENQRKSSPGLTHSSKKKPTRRSLDISRHSFGAGISNGKNILPTRKSLDSRISRETNERRSLDMSQAAVLAWTASQRSLKGEVSLKQESKKTQKQKSARKAKINMKLKDNSDSTKSSDKKSNIKSPKMKSTPAFQRESTIGKGRSKEDKLIKAAVQSESVPITNDLKNNLSSISLQSLNEESPIDARIKHIMDTLHGVDAESCQQIINDIMISDSKIYWDDIAGLEKAKNSLKEAVVYPFLRPDLFKGLREPIRGMLLFGPPGTGKTMIAKAVATESKSTFFSISASSLLSKYLGESEKLVRSLFYLAKRMAPSIIFIDEIDSLLSDRTDNTNESSRRIKTELLIQWSALSSATAREDTPEGVSQTLDNRVLVLSATNLPWVIDEAARRRFTRRLYIPLPDFNTRMYHIRKLMSRQKNILGDEDFEKIALMTNGYSGSDITALAKEAAMEPIRDLGENLMDANFESVRPVDLKDFIESLNTIKMSVSKESLQQYEQWANLYGSTGS